MSGKNIWDDSPVKPAPGNPIKKILYVHPGKSSYHDNTIWIPFSAGLGSGFWIKPGEAIAIVSATATATPTP